ncbi:PDZ domain-containing protein, partial [bacterium]|nr:PDZ domain-containing protein [bacterium]
MIRFLLPTLIFLSLLAKEPPKLKVHDVSHRMEEMLRAHAQIHEVNNEILERTLLHFVDEMDRTRSYFLEEEVTPLIKLDQNSLTTLRNAIHRGDFQYFSHLVQLFKKAVSRHNTLLLNPKLQSITPKKLEAKEESFAQSEEALLDKLGQLRAHTLFMADQIGPNMQEKILGWSDKKRLKFEEEWVSLTKELEERLIYSTFLKSFARSLDAHTSYFTPDEAADFMVHVQQRLYGIGAMLRDDFDGLIILKLIEGGPAARSGKVQVDDKIIAVDSEPVMGLSIQDAVALIRGKKGTSVTLTLLRKNEHLTVPVIR